MSRLVDPDNLSRVDFACFTATLCIFFGYHGLFLWHNYRVPHTSMASHVDYFHINLNRQLASSKASEAIALIQCLRSNSMVVIFFAHMQLTFAAIVAKSGLRSVSLAQRVRSIVPLFMAFVAYFAFCLVALAWHHIHFISTIDASVAPPLPGSPAAAAIAAAAIAAQTAATETKRPGSPRRHRRSQGAGAVAVNVPTDGAGSAGPVSPTAPALASPASAPSPASTTRVRFSESTLVRKTAGKPAEEAVNVPAPAATATEGAATARSTVTDAAAASATEESVSPAAATIETATAGAAAAAAAEPAPAAAHAVAVAEHDYVVHTISATKLAGAALQRQSALHLRVGWRCTFLSVVLMLWTVSPVLMLVGCVLVTAHLGWNDFPFPVRAYDRFLPRSFRARKGWQGEPAIATAIAISSAEEIRVLRQQIKEASGMPRHMKRKLLKYWKSVERATNKRASAVAQATSSTIGSFAHVASAGLGAIGCAASSGLDAVAHVASRGLGRRPATSRDNLGGEVSDEAAVTELGVVALETPQNDEVLGPTADNVRHEHDDARADGKPVAPASPASPLRRCQVNGHVVGEEQRGSSPERVRDVSHGASPKAAVATCAPETVSSVVHVNSDQQPLQHSDPAARQSDALAARTSSVVAYDTDSDDESATSSASASDSEQVATEHTPSTISRIRSLHLSRKEMQDEDHEAALRSS